MLCGEPKNLMANMTTFIKERPLAEDPSKKGKVDVDDAFEAIFEFENGAIGTIEASRFCPGRKNFNTLEINGEKGSLWWDLENLNNLHVYFKDEDPEDTRGFHKVNVTESYHPYFEKWWPHGHIIGWENTFVHTMYNMVNAIINDAKLDPLAATFEDGYKNAVICDAIVASSEAGKKVDIIY
jgi:predicted dehydrogenase